MTGKLSDEEKARRKELKRNKKAESPTATAEKTKPRKAEVVKPLAVEINFPAIMDLKQAIATDADGNLIIGIQFKAKVDQFEVFRLINLLKQPHGNLYCLIGSPQSAMDFKFDEKQLRFEIFKATPNPVSTMLEDMEGVGVERDVGEVPVTELTDQEPEAVKFHAVAFNHIPEEKKPYGVAIDYAHISDGEIHSVAGRGKNPSEAVLVGLKATNALPTDMKEPFEIMTALEAMDPSPECYKLIRVLEVGSFEDVSEGGEQPPKGD